MKKYYCNFLRAFQAVIECETMEDAQRQAIRIHAEFPEGSCRLLSIKAEDYVEPADAKPEPTKGPDGREPTGPKGKPPTGPTPGTPTVAEAVITEAVAQEKAA